MDESKVTLAAGDAAPQIDADITQGGLFDLSLERGKWVVVYFFPRSGTPG
jgi:peroxiredoxin